MGSFSHLHSSVSSPATCSPQQKGHLLRDGLLRSRTGTRVFLAGAGISDVQCVTNPVSIFRLYKGGGTFNLFIILALGPRAFFIASSQEVCVKRMKEGRSWSPFESTDL